ncbi:MAG: hypothetical protein JXR36_09315, partial [Bacteroidales bacterium]|nr:hypothetical protein [Bacteroidales bacterium]
RLEYYTNAIIMNAVIDFHKDTKSKRRAMGHATGGIWEGLSNIINSIRPEYKHTLPKTHGSLRNKATNYQKNGYDELISGKYGNSNGQKVSSIVEKIIISLYVLEHKPYEEDVWRMYNRFINGDFILFDKKTGEVYDINSVLDKNNEPIQVGLTTVRNYIKKHRASVDKKRNDFLYYNNQHRPHHHRKSPMFSLSKLTLDDRNLPPVLTSGKHVMAYFVWDVASETILGYAFSTNKDKPLFIEAMQSAFRTIHANGLGMPFEVEVEHHLVSSFKTELEILFPFVRWSAGGNAQEKRAEHFNRIFKYQYEKLEFPTGRFYAKHEANRPNVQKEWNEEGMQDKIKKYTYEEVVGIYHKLINRYNNDPHPKIEGKTRMEVLIENVNPTCASLPLPIIAKSFGYKTETSLRRSQYMQVQYFKYTLPSPKYLDKINNNQGIDAYWLHDDEMNIPEVYIYQNGNYIATCPKIERYNEATVEQTDKDEAIKLAQNKYVNEFDKRINDDVNEMMTLGFIENTTDDIEDEQEDDFVYELQNKEEFEYVPEYSGADYAKKGNDY